MITYLEKLFSFFCQLMNEEVAKKLGGSLDGPVYTYTEDQMRANSSFSTLPPAVLDVHLGSMVFATSFGQYKGIQLQKFALPVPSKKVSLKRLIPFYYFLNIFSFT